MVGLLGWILGLVAVGGWVVGLVKVGATIEGLVAIGVVMEVGKVRLTGLLADGWILVLTWLLAEDFKAFVVVDGLFDWTGSPFSRLSLDSSSCFSLYEGSISSFSLEEWGVVRSSWRTPINIESYRKGAIYIIFNQTHNFKHSLYIIKNRKYSYS